MREINRDVKITDSNISENTKIYSQVIIKNSKIDKGVPLGDDTVIVNSRVAEYCEIDRRNYIHNSIIGRFTYSGWNTYIGFTDIGKFCSLSRNVDIGGCEHNYKAVTTMPVKKIMQMKTGVHPEWKECKKVHIGNDVWIGQGAAILNKGGITIADGAVVAAGAVVCNDIGPYEIWGGVPAKFIKYRFRKEWIMKLLEIEWWNFPLSMIENNIKLFQGNLSEDIIVQLQNLKSRIGEEDLCGW